MKKYKSTRITMIHLWSRLSDALNRKKVLGVMVNHELNKKIFTTNHQDRYLITQVKNMMVCK